MSNNIKLINILLVEDNELDAEATMIAAEECCMANRLTLVENGQEALDYLYQRGKYKGHPLPDLILLDLNLPGVDGREVLEVVKTDDKLKTIPVIILTTSELDEDIIESYSHGANAYVRKPVVVDGFLEIIKSIEVFWFGIVKLPKL